MASLANAIRGVALRGCAQQLRRQTPTAVVATSMRSSTAQQTRSMSVFSNLKDTVTQKIEERNQGKQGNLCGQ